MHLTIRTAERGDSSTIASFNQRMAVETEDKTLVDDVIQAGVLAVISDSSRGTYYVACDGERTVGQLMITLEWSDWRNGWFWWIQSVFVEPDARKHGVFRALYAHVKQLAAERDDVCGIRLYVEKENTRAQATYLSLGMDMTHYLLMEEEFD
ncbi:MAG: GNAT family N-acetyltransferase [Gammaproteobacteria bacterium]